MAAVGEDHGSGDPSVLRARVAMRARIGRDPLEARLLYAPGDELREADSAIVVGIDLAEADP